jgi:hypothetical protein
MLLLRSAGLALALLVFSNSPILAQVCTANVANPSQVRAYGLSELVGDIVVVCSGVPPLPAGAPIPQFNLTIMLNMPVTSRILDTQTGATEARLLVDEPGANWPSPMVNGYGPSAPQILCPAPLTGCPQQIGYVQTGYAGPIAVPVLPGVSTPPPVQDAPNVYQGVLTAQNQLTFFRVPLVPSSLIPVGPGWSGSVFRMTNLRANVAGQVNMLASVTASAPVMIQSPLLTVANVFNGFSAPNGNLNVVACPAGSICPLGTLRFTEGFASAAKTRVAGGTYGLPPTPQNIPGLIYGGSESGFYAPAMTGATPATASAGLADFGTRLKSVIRTPPGVRLWVATGIPWTGSGAYLNATLTRTENGPFSGVPADLIIDGRQVAELPIVNGNAIAVWEVLSANPASQERFEFPLYVSYPNGVAPPMPLTVRGSLAPTFEDGAFPPDGVFAQGPAYPIPRFLRVEPSILLPPALTVAPGQFTAFLLTLPRPAGPEGVAITLTSSDPSVATVTPTAFVFGGATSPDRRLPTVTGLRFGRTTVTASAPSLGSGVMTVDVTLAMSFSPAALAASRSSRQARPLLVLSAPPPSGGVTVMLLSDNPAIAAVPPSVFIPEGAVSAPFPITLGDIGATIIRARAPFFPADWSMPVIVTP